MESRLKKAETQINMAPTGGKAGRQQQGVTKSLNQSEWEYTLNKAESVHLKPIFIIEL